MPNEDNPKGGVHLNWGFGEARGHSPAARREADVPFELLIVGDFGGARDGRVRDISSEDFQSLLASFGAAVTMAVPNRLGSTPPALAVNLPIASMRDLDPKAAGARIPEIVAAQKLAAAFAEGRSADFETLAADRKLDLVVTALRRTAPAKSASAAPASPPATVDDGALDRLLGMIDMPGEPARPDPAKAAVAAFISAQAKPQAPAATGSASAIEALVLAQIREAVADPAWLGIEAAWRSLRLIFTARGQRAASRLSLCDVERDALVTAMESDAFAEALAEAPPMRAILVLGAFARSPKDLDELDRVALVAERLATPAIVSLAADFLGAPPQDVAAMDDPAALLEAPGYAAWRGLRSRVESRSLLAAWNDFVLRPNAGEAPVLWGEPGIIVAAQILRSLVRTGWPTEILGAESALGGLDVVETTVGGRAAAIPLRAAPDLTRARDLAEEGLACLMARPDRDQVWLTRAPCLYAQGRAAETDRKAMEILNSLPFGFVSAYFEHLLRAESALFAKDRSDEQAADALQTLLNDVLLTTGQGGAARVESFEEEGRRRFEATIRLGGAVLGGFDFSFDFAL